MKQATNNEQYLRIGKLLKLRRESLNLSQQEVAEYVNVTKSAVSRWESGGVENIGRSKIQGLSEILQMSPVKIILGEEPENLPPVKTDTISPPDTTVVLVPIVGRISCGNGVFAYEDIEGYEPTPKEWLAGGDHFYLRAKGDSMIGARIHEDDLLLIRKQPVVENGEIAAVMVEEEALLKRVYRNNGQLVLQSENPKYPPIFAPPAETTIIGKLKKVVINFEE